MFRDYSKVRLFWTKHAVAEALEDNFDVREIEKNLVKVLEIPEFDYEKRRGVVKVGSRYCTLIYLRKKKGLIVVTCWESNKTDAGEYNHALKGVKRGVG